MISGFAYMWEFDVKPDSVDEFVRLNGPDGEWAQLFSNADGYLKTEFHRDVNTQSRFVTVDYWESKTHVERFRRRCADAFEKIDRKGEALTTSERPVGEFTFTSR